jgi:hypothetical protein
MRKSTAEKIVARLNDAGYKASVRDGYSGRFMFGKTVIAIVTDADPMTFTHIAKRKLRADNMGLGYVYY